MTDSVRARTRALAQLRTPMTQYEVRNPLFANFVPEFTSSLQRDLGVNLDFYIPHQLPFGGTFEDKVLNLLFPTSSVSEVPAIYFLRGDVGVGKTSFVKHFTQRLLPTERPGVLSLILDAWNRLPPSLDVDSVYAQAFIEIAQTAVLQGTSPLFANQREYYESLCSYLGYGDLPPQDLPRVAETRGLPDIVRFLLAHPKIHGLLIVLDNLDENSKDIISGGLRFVERIKAILAAADAKPVRMLLPLRTYTSNTYISTKHHSELDLPALDPMEVLRARLHEAHDEIAGGWRDITQDVVTIVADGRQARRVTITRKKACSFLQGLAGYLSDKEEVEAFRLIQDLSAGNLKMLVGNLYNLMHSIKLPLAPIFQRWFMEQEALLSPAVPHDQLGSNLACECLMAVHYPFYDVHASFVVNLFNVMNSEQASDWQNTLTLPRVLGYVLNRREVTFARLVEDLTDIGYAAEYVHAALDRCLRYGLLSTEHGYTVQHLSDASQIWASAAASLYMDRLVVSPSYLQYACEDTPMPESFLVDIGSKYRVGASGMSAKALRMESVMKLIEFVGTEEELEWQCVARRWKGTREAYLARTGPRTSGGRRLADFMADSARPAVHGILARSEG